MSALGDGDRACGCWLIFSHVAGDESGTVNGRPRDVSIPDVENVVACSAFTCFSVRFRHEHEHKHFPSI